MLITRLLPKKNAGKLIVCNLILIFLFSYFSFSVFADNPTDEPVAASTEKTTAATEIFTENVTEMETESSTETLKSINDSISVKDLLLIIAVMLLLLIVIAVIRFIL